jgi:hypothetical protein
MDFSKMDFKKIIDLSELKKTLTRLENIAALSLILFFFFPWASLGPFSVNGFGAASENALLFLVPLLGILVVIMRPICQVPTILKGVKLAAGILPIAGFIIALIDGGTKVFNFLGMGAYFTLIAGVLIILGTLNIVQLPNALPAVDEESDAVEDTTTEA